MYFKSVIFQIKFKSFADILTFNIFKSGTVVKIRNLSRGTPFTDHVHGICVGMQMMARRSDEGNMEGLGWIAAEVRKFPDSCDDYPLPHMGWNNISLTGEYPLTKDLTDDKRFYFLHSYYMDCEDQSNILALASYSSEFSCIVQNNNIYGIQCHPEKSHKNGISILKNFSEV